MACPAAYRLGARALRDAPTLRASTLYAVGGLYGNLHALKAVRERAEVDHAAIVFNGDFNFFNATPDAWCEVNREIRLGVGHYATAGNVEVESSDPNSVGCGCGYPAYVSTAVADRSDRIVAQLRAAAQSAAITHTDAPELLEWVRTLPRALVAEIGSERQRVGIVHGDVDSLGGWQLAVEAMEPADEGLRVTLDCNRGDTRLATTPHSRLLGWFKEAEVQGLLSTHTCLPFGQTLRGGSAHVPGGDTAGEGGELAVFNNGSAGMPNFAGGTFGLMTRVSSDPTPPADSLYGALAGGLRYDAVPVRYDHEAWLSDFTAMWPEGSDAHASYHGRVQNGPTFGLADACRQGCRLGDEARGHWWR